METRNGQIKDLVDATDNTDGITAEQATVTYQGTNNTITKQILAKEYCGSVTVSGGTATYYLTTDGTSTGTALFSNNVFKSTANFWVDDANNSFVYGGYTVSNSNRTLVVSISRLSASSSNALINLLGAVTSFLTGIVFTGAANGTVVHLRIRGN